jgi:hypothetical protein
MEQAKVNVVRGIDLREVVSIEEGAEGIRITFVSGDRNLLVEMKAKKFLMLGDWIAAWERRQWNE